MGERVRATTVRIAAPADRVWSVMTDVGRWPDWSESVAEVHLEVELTVVTGGALAGFVDRVYGKKTQRFIEMEAAGLRRACEA